MKRFKLLLGVGIVTVLASLAVAAVPQLINFQGILKDGSGNPVANASYSVTFTIYDTPAGGSVQWAETTSVTTSSGLFTVLLGAANPVPDSAFNNPNRWLGIKVGADPEMTPRQQLVSVAYGFRISSVDSASGGTITSKVSIGPGHTNTGSDAFVTGALSTASGNNATVSGGLTNTASGDRSTVSGGGLNLASQPFATVGGGGANNATAPSSVIGGGFGNVASGNSATVSGGAFDTASNDNATVGGGKSNRATGNSATVGGGNGNTASGEGATVGGGGINTASGAAATVGGGSANIASGSQATVGGGAANTAMGNSATVGGGQSNTATNNWATVGGGFSNTASNEFAMVGGGRENSASSLYATVGGGSVNNATAPSSVVGGGYDNDASGNSATVSGGAFNTASGQNSTVPGGYSNNASGNNSLAAGRRAKANHLGSFVWADSTVDADFSSTGNNQFLIRASGGVGIGTNSPQAALHVVGENIRVEQNGLPRFSLNSSGAAADQKKWQNYASTTALNFTALNDAENAETFWLQVARGAGTAITSVTFPSGNVGIGTTTPSEKLHVVGNICATGTIAACSDARYKTNLREIPDALNKVKSLNGIFFNWKRDEFPAMGFKEGNQVGFVAQELKEVLPEAVSQGSDGYYSVDYGRLTPLLVEAIKELKSENVAKEETIGKLVVRVNQLEEMVQKLLAREGNKSESDAKFGSAR